MKSSLPFLTMCRSIFRSHSDWAIWLHLKRLKLLWQDMLIYWFQNGNENSKCWISKSKAQKASDLRDSWDSVLRRPDPKLREGTGSIGLKQALVPQLQILWLSFQRESRVGCLVLLLLWTNPGGKTWMQFTFSLCKFFPL